MESKTAFQDISLLLARLAFGGSMLYGHGLRKVQRILTSGEVTFSDPIGLGPELSLYLAAFAECVCAGLIILGLFTRLATIPLIFTMLVVLVFIQLRNSFGDMEVPLLYLFGFLLILAFGAGHYSLDVYRKKLW